jgi:hypothetical protein
MPRKAARSLRLIKRHTLHQLWIDARKKPGEFLREQVITRARFEARVHRLILGLASEGKVLALSDRVT